MHSRIVTILESRLLKLKELGIAEGIEDSDKKKRRRKWKMKLKASLTKRCLQSCHNFQGFLVYRSSKMAQMLAELNQSSLVWVVFPRHHLLLGFQVLLVLYRL